MKYIIILVLGFYLGANISFPKEYTASKDINILFKNECELKGQWEIEKKVLRSRLYRMRRHVHLGLN